MNETNFITIGSHHLSLDIEIGNNKPVEPNLLDKTSPNENFTITHRKCKILLPECDEYKPHLNIKCECYGSLFVYSSIDADLDLLKRVVERKILIGSYTVKSIAHYIFDNQKLAQYLRKNSKYFKFCSFLMFFN